LKKLCQLKKSPKMNAQQKKEEIVAYLEKYNIQENITSAVNELTKLQPSAGDIWLWLSDYFKGMAASPTIARLEAREILDSRGNPTVQVDVYGTVRGQEVLLGRGNAPSGASTGSNEALEIRDKEKRMRGKGVKKAVANVAKLSEVVKGMRVADLNGLDEAMCKADGTTLKTNLGGNAITAASFAVAESHSRFANEDLFLHFAKVFNKEADVSKLPKMKCPIPMCNILNGGKHAEGDLQIQEFMIIPAESMPFKKQLECCAEVYHALGKIMKENYGASATHLGDEGGFAPNIKDATEALNRISEAIKAAGYEENKDVFYALDCAASEFYDEEKKQYEIEPKKFISSDDLVKFYVDLHEKFPALISIEDGMEEKDYEGWIALTAALGEKIMLVGDDLYTTNTELIKKGLDAKWANALLLKVNQIGTISESMDAARMLFAVNQNVIVSHRSGETTSSAIADLAVGIGAKYIKTGATARGERVCKYNRLLQIEEVLAKMNKE